MEYVDNSNCVQARNTLSSMRNKLSKEESITPADIKALNAVTNAIGRETATAKLQLEYAKIMGLEPNIDYIKTPPGTKSLVKKERQ